MELPDAFKDFNKKLELSTKAVDRIESAASTLRSRLQNSLDLEASDIFLQGSYENGTATPPADESGEYDVDLVAERDWTGSPDEVLDELEAVLAEYDSYKQMLEPKDACICLRYAPEKGVGGFHVDIIPARPPGSDSGNSDSPLEVPRRGGEWHETDPKGFTTWCKDQGEDFARTVKQLKRWRAVHQTEQKTIKSIVLQVLIADALAVQDTQAETLRETLRGIKTRLDQSPNSAPVVLNPSLESENLAKKWPDDDYRDFRSELDEAVDLAERALASDDEGESHDLWQELLGDDFPAGPSEPSKGPGSVVPPVPAKPRPRPKPDGGRTYG